MHHATHLFIWIIRGWIQLMGCFKVPSQTERFTLQKREGVKHFFSCYCKTETVHILTSWGKSSLFFPAPPCIPPQSRENLLRICLPPTSIHTAKSNLRCWFGSQSSPPQPHHDSRLRMREVFSRLIFLYLSTATLLLFCNRIFPPSPKAFPGHSITLQVPDDTPPITSNSQVQPRKIKSRKITWKASYTRGARIKIGGFEVVFWLFVFRC